MFPESLSLLTHSQPFTATSIVQDTLRLGGYSLFRTGSVLRMTVATAQVSDQRENGLQAIGSLGLPVAESGFFYSGALKSRFSGPTPGDSDSWVLGGV